MSVAVLNEKKYCNPKKQRLRMSMLICNLNEANVLVLILTVAPPGILKSTEKSSTLFQNCNSGGKLEKYREKNK